jgi:hypothetical protein
MWQFPKLISQKAETSTSESRENPWTKLSRMQTKRVRVEMESRVFVLDCAHTFAHEGDGGVCAPQETGIEVRIVSRATFQSGSCERQ